MGTSLIALAIWLAFAVGGVYLHGSNIVAYRKRREIVKRDYPDDRDLNRVAWMSLRSEIFLILFNLIVLFVGGLAIPSVATSPKAVNMLSWMLIMLVVLVGIKSVWNRYDNEKIRSGK
jgi:hypothetical protein